MLLLGSILNLRAAILRPQSLSIEKPLLDKANAGKLGTGQENPRADSSAAGKVTL